MSPSEVCLVWPVRRAFTRLLEYPDSYHDGLGQNMVIRASKRTIRQILKFVQNSSFSSKMSTQLAPFYFVFSVANQHMSACQFVPITNWATRIISHLWASWMPVPDSRPKTADMSHEGKTGAARRNVRRSLLHRTALCVNRDHTTGIIRHGTERL